MDETFDIVGVTETGSSLLQNLTGLIPGMVYIPYTTLQEMTARDGFDQIAVRCGPTRMWSPRKRGSWNRSSGVSGHSGGYSGRTNLAVQKERLGG